MRHSTFALILALACLTACSSKSTPEDTNPATDSEPNTNPGSSDAETADNLDDADEADTETADDLEDASTEFAEVTDVDISGESGAYTFSVTVRSPETGCDQYADWWEVVDAETDELIYRRILAHSHVDEQPFTRSGGPVDIQPDTNVFVRAHMNTSGYSPVVVQIAPDGAFELIEVGSDYAEDLASQAPLPDGCAF